MKLNEPIYYLNGKFIAKSRTKISVGDLGFVRGYGVFDYIVTYKDGLPFLIKKHLQRLFTSAKLIGLKIPWTLPELEKLINKTIQVLYYFLGKLVPIIESQIGELTPKPFSESS